MFDSKISQKMTAHAKKSLREAEQIARHYNSKEVNPEHLFLAIFLQQGSLGNIILKNLGIKRGDLNKLLPFKKGRRMKRKIIALPFSFLLKSVITRSYLLANSFGYPYVGTEHLVYALIESANPAIQKIIKNSKSKEIPLKNILQASLSNDLFPNLSKLLDIPDITLTGSKNNHQSPTPYLDQFCLNVNKDALIRNEIIVERDREIKRIAIILGRKNKNNPLLLGEPGVGKTAVVYGLAQKINSGDVPQAMLDKKILSLDMALVVAGTSFRGEFEMRLKEIIREAGNHKEVILFIDEIHNIIGAGNVSGGLDAANILKPALSRGDVQCIGATTLTEFKKHIERDPAFERRFQPVKISEPTAEKAGIILSKVKANYEKFHNITISDEAINRAVSLSIRYISDRFLPDKALDVIDETASAIRSQCGSSGIAKKIKSLITEKKKLSDQKNDLVRKENYEEAATLRQKERELERITGKFIQKQKEIEALTPVSISIRDINQTVSQMTGIPIEKISSQMQDFKIKNLEKNLKKHIVGQKETTEQIANALLRSYSGISNPDRPLGSFLFLGPTGVGKTLTAKILSQEIFGSPQALIRIDMSEFMERHNVARLIGAPAGYVGYEEGGKLTEKVRHQPYSVVLFDEIEKAHPDVANILLQILEDGILTDAEGRQVSFKNIIIILTSNLGTEKFTSAAGIGFGNKSEEKNTNNQFILIKNNVLEELKRNMKPEILNRLDHIFVFNALGKYEIKKIAALELENLKKRLQKQGLDMNYSSKITGFIAQKSLAPEQGARLVRKKIQELVENPIAELIVYNKVVDGKITVGVEKGKIIII